MDADHPHPRALLDFLSPTRAELQLGPEGFLRPAEATCGHQNGLFGQKKSQVLVKTGRTVFMRLKGILRTAEGLEGSYKPQIPPVLNTCRIWYLQGF